MKQANNQWMSLLHGWYLPGMLHKKHHLCPCRCSPGKEDRRCWRRSLGSTLSQRLCVSMKKVYPSIREHNTTYKRSLPIR